MTQDATDASSSDKNPASLIVIGAELAGGWVVVEKYGNERCGRYSTGFRVKNKDGRDGFLKALTYDFYLLSANPAEQLKAALDAYSLEARLLRSALEHNLDRVVKIYTGETLRDSSGRTTVSYLIFELAEDDGRQQLDASSRAEYLDCIRMLHDVAVGVSQLHRIGIAHQDIRAANVLCFKSRRAKIADLGKAVDPHAIAEHVEDLIAGDETYAPPELLYNFVPGDWNVRRFGCDFYLLGSLIVTFFLGTGMTPQMLGALPEKLRPSEWVGTRYEDILAYLQNAAASVFDRLAHQMRKETGDGRWAEEIVGIVRELCDPDPARRGDSVLGARGANPLSLERYLSKLDRLTKQAEIYRKRAS
jgi:serine/threonine protein kinase